MLSASMSFVVAAAVMTFCMVMVAANGVRIVVQTAA